MRPELFGLDHLMIATPSLPDVRAVYQRLGFTVTPYRTNEPMGGGKTGGKGGNHLVMMTPTDDRMANYLELAYADPEKAAPFMNDILSQKPGLAMLVHSGDALKELDAHWQNEGLPACNFYELDTAFTDPETNITDRIHFQVLVPTARQGPVSVNACRYFERDHYLREDWRTHANGARHWSGVTIVRDDLDAARAYLTKVYGEEPGRDDGRLFVTAGLQSLNVIDTHHFRSRYPDEVRRRSDGSEANTVVEVITSSIEKAEDALSGSSVALVKEGSRIIVLARECDGVIIVFAEASP